MKIEWIELHPDDQGVLTRPPNQAELPMGCDLKTALETLGFTQTTELLQKRKVAIFGKYGLPDTLLHEGDRIEILDDLRFDPKESRRRRHFHKTQADLASKPGKAAPRKSKKQV